MAAFVFGPVEWVLARDSPKVSVGSASAGRDFCARCVPASPSSLTAPAECRRDHLLPVAVSKFRFVAPTNSKRDLWPFGLVAFVFIRLEGKE